MIIRIIGWFTLEYLTSYLTKIETIVREILVKMQKSCHLFFIFSRSHLCRILNSHNYGKELLISLTKIPRFPGHIHMKASPLFKNISISETNNFLWLQLLRIQHYFHCIQGALLKWRNSQLPFLFYSFVYKLGFPVYGQIHV